ncbi:MAG TPA: hypothetical protein DIC52_10180 [Candidatus Latescibacteria bacterium]|nr:hypothetical protein [Candidatus Latescibacterota bacterium]
MWGDSVMAESVAAFRVGYIISPRQDAFWFLTLPFVAILFALGAQRYLPGGALAAIALWVTVPHHFVTWLRVYGSADEFSRFRERFIIGPILMLAGVYLLIQHAPLSLVLLVTLWDHQHSLMQQYGFSRVYDFKAKAGSSLTGRFDLALNWILFVNMLVVSPLFSVIWVRMLHEWHLGVETTVVLLVQQLSWAIAGTGLIVYLMHTAWCMRRGYALNPMKYLFLFASYFLWYYTSFTTTYLLVYAIAHRIMHGTQYIVMVYSYLRNKEARGTSDSTLHAWVARRGNLRAFLLLCIAYAMLFHALTEGHIRDFGFGVIGFNTNFDLFAYSLLSSFALLHYYYDAFIWKVRRPEVQRGL